MKIYYHYNSISSLWICEKRDVLTKFPSKVVVVVVYKKFYHINHHIALLPYTGSLHSTTWEGLQSSSLLRPTITSNPFSISWAFKLAHEMPLCVGAAPLLHSTPSCRKLKCKSNRDDEGDLELSHQSTK